jgi:hypothetical protein
MAMQYLNAKLKGIDVKEYRHRSAAESDCSILIDEDTTIMVDGKPLVVYIANVSGEAKMLFDALTKIKYDSTVRTSGLVTSSRIFGYAPRNGIRNLPCRSTSLARESPKENRILKKFASVAAHYYNKTNEDLAKRHQQMTDEKVLGNYKMDDSMFTSGIVNHNNPLKYHFDSGNYVGVWSAMFAFKRDIEGGHLACPELDIAFKCSNHSLTMFDGQSILHGVTPIKKMKSDAVRYTVVYYSLKSMWSCETPQNEVERMRGMRQEIELKRKVNK